MFSNRDTEILASEITTLSTITSRRSILAGLGMAAAVGLPESALAASPSDMAGGEAPTSLARISSYNNYYEFGTEKGDAFAGAKSLKTEPWTVVIEGECDKPGTYALGDILKGRPLEDRIYRHRCVEAWSMVVPWRGFTLGSLLAAAEPTSKAKYVSFETLLRPSEMSGQNSSIMPWPYREGLRMDEAMHPLVLLATGMHGVDLPNQNGAPLRLVVPWKYGFKGIKAIVRIRLREDMPQTSWTGLAAAEYGFFANVNPLVDHPRWSQANERRIGEFFRRPTLPFNGYAEQVAQLYAGMDLRGNF